MRKHKIIGGLLGAVLLLNSFSITGFVADEETNGTGTTYYIDSDGGNDENSGTSPEEAWSSLEKINETTFQPGDEILFEKGDVWAGQLSPKGSGEKGNPIVIASYGESDAIPEDVLMERKGKRLEERRVKETKDWDLSGDIFDCINRYSAELTEEQLDEIIKGLEPGLSEKEVKSCNIDNI